MASGGVSRQDRRTLERWERRGGSLSERARLVLGWLDGMSQRAVARRHGTTPQRVRRWCRRVVAEGPPGLVDRPRSGAPSRAPRARVRAAFARGMSTYEVARHCGISQPTASRLGRELALQPEAPRATSGPARALFVGPGHRVLVVAEAGEAAEATALPEGPDLERELEQARRGRVIAGRRSNVKLRRFLRRCLRRHPGPLRVISTSPADVGPAVRKLAEATPRLRWHQVATHAIWRRLVEAWRPPRASPASR